MIYTITCNPSLDYHMSVTNYCHGGTNRAIGELLVAGGKGINVSTVLGNLGQESICLGFVAGFTGEEIVRQLEQRKLRTDFVFCTEGNSRINVKLSEMEDQMPVNAKESLSVVSETEINGLGPVVSPEDQESLWHKLSSMQTGDVCVLSGSLAKGMPSTFYKQATALCQEKGALAIVDTTKEALLSCLEERPFLIKPNLEELLTLFSKVQREELWQKYGAQAKAVMAVLARENNIPAPKENQGRYEEIICLCMALQEKGARNILVSLAGDGALLCRENGEVFILDAPKGCVKSSVGAGDSMVAGFLYGLLSGNFLQTIAEKQISEQAEREMWKQAFRYGLAAGSASAFSEKLATLEEIKQLYDMI